MRGSFITFEGGEGSGKTTQLKFLAQAFVHAGREACLTREPGGTPGAEAIRDLLLHRQTALDSLAETLLFLAARADHVARKIHPELERGATVLCDRFVDSTFVYQCLAEGRGLTWHRMLHNLIFGGLAPDLTIILDIDPEIGLARAKHRAAAATYFDAKSVAYHTRIREGFQQIAAMEPQRCVLLDANQDAQALHQAIVERINAHFGMQLTPIQPEALPDAASA